MSIRVEVLTGDALIAALPGVAALRVAVFRAFPYLYDGDAAYEERYLQTYRDTANATLVGAFEGDMLIGAATGTPMQDHATEFGAAFAGHPWPLPEIFYCAESVLLPAYRGQGIGHRFFELREAHARALGHRFSCFCAVVRADDHPLRPANYQPLDAFWRKRGYHRLDGVSTQYSWRDLGAAEETAKHMQFWGREL